MFLCPQCRAPANAPRCPSGHPALPISGLKGWRAGELRGVGGFARVYECFDADFRRAIKIVNPSEADDPESLRDAFRREHRALSRLTHAHVIALIHAEEVASLLCLVTEYVPLTLADVFRPGRPLAVQRAVHLAAQLADGLAYMHDEGISHRDLKPKNIGLERDDHLRLFDFGLSGQHRADTATSRDVRGFSRPYAAPEQLLPDVYGPAGPWTDRYSFAAVLYELLSGRGHRPRGVELGYQVYVDQPIPPLPVDAARPPELDRLIFDCLKVHPDHRPRDTWPIQDLLADLNDRLGAGYGEARARFVEVRDELGKKGTEIKELERRRAALIGEGKAIEGELSRRRSEATAALQAEIRALTEHTRALKTESAGIRERVQKERVEAAQNLEQRQGESQRVQAVIAENEAAAEAELARIQSAIGRAMIDMQEWDNKAKTARRRRFALLFMPIATVSLGLGLGVGLFLATPPTIEESAPLTPGWLASMATPERPALRFVPQGRFTMSGGEEVELTAPYLMFETEVTQAQWRVVVGNSPSFFKNCDTCPVEQVSWWDAVAYANALSAREGLVGCYDLSGCGPATNRNSCTSIERRPGCKGYRLPTEAEWEWAALAGMAEAISSEPDSVGWYHGNASGKTHPVGSKAANAWGLRDMVGNVWEWCEDRKEDYPPGLVVDPIGFSRGDRRAIRGGSIRVDASALGAISRNLWPPEDWSGFQGFRLVRSGSL